MPSQNAPPAQRPMIVTAWIKPSDLKLINNLRESLFPADKNYLPAHLTLFHHIPFTVRQEFIGFCQREMAGIKTFPVRVQPPFNLGHGVAYRVESQTLSNLRARLRESFADHLTAQDDRAWKRPHITVQNKVDPATARHTLTRLQNLDLPDDLRILGLEFNRYDGGPWTLLAQMRFAEK